MDHQYIEDHNIADRYVMDKLSVEERNRFELHFITCERCVDLIGEISDFRQALEAMTLQQESAVPVEELPVKQARRGAWRQAAVAVAVISLIILQAIFIKEIHSLRNELSQAKTAATEAESAGQASPRTIEPAPAASGQKTEREQPKQPLKTEIAKTTTAPARPQVNTQIVQLSTIRGEERTNEIEVTGSPELIVLMFDLETGPKYKSYRAKFLKDGKRIKSPVKNMIPKKHDSLSMHFNSNFLPPGRYVIDLEGIAGDGSAAWIASYPLVVVKKGVNRKS
jgi:hypothetical protein